MIPVNRETSRQQGETMKIAYFDCFSGISGDMTLGALVDVGVDPGALKAELSKLKLDAEFVLDFEKTSKHHISAAREQLYRRPEASKEDISRTAESSEGADAHPPLTSITPTKRINILITGMLRVGIYQTFSLFLRVAISNRTIIVQAKRDF